MNAVPFRRLAASHSTPPRPRVPACVRLLAPSAAIALSGLAPASSAAQTSILELLPVEGELRLPDAGSATVATGTLSGSELLLPSGAPAQAWTFEGETGDRIVVTLRSGSFDAVVFVVGPGLGGGETDDDGGGGGGDARLCLTLPERGTYRAVASAFGEDSAGSFELSLMRVAPADEEVLCPVEPTEAELWEAAPVGAVSSPQTVSGRLTEEEEASVIWELEAPAGQPLSVILRSDEFDTYAEVRANGAEENLSQDDDSGGGCDSRIDFTPAEGESYRIRVSAIVGGGGVYELSVTPEAPPSPEEPCEGI